MIASIVTALIKLFYEIIKNQSGPITAIAAPAVPDELRDRWTQWVRDRSKGGVH
jgi:hypothetical protein